MSDRRETFVQKQLRLNLEKECRVMGDRLAAECPPGAGFALFIFDYGEPNDPGAVAYISNADRSDMLRLIEEWLVRKKAEALCSKES